MTEEKEEGKKDWIAWVKHLVAAVVGAIVTLLATIGVIGKDDAAIAKDKADAVLDKSEQAYVQVTEVSTAVAEVKSYLANRYDVATIFAQTGNNRSALIVEHVKVCAVYHLLLLCNVDAIYERYEKAYDRTIDFLKKVADGLLSPDLPYLQTDTGTPAGTIQLKSNPKFTHSF